MANVEIIIAGGGTRTHQNIPKQFIYVNGRSVIIYTLEAFQRHLNIDAIEISSLRVWYDIVNAYVRRFSITKLENILDRGKTGQEHIRNGLCDIVKRYYDDMVVIHDTIRLLASVDIIPDNIRYIGNMALRQRRFRVHP